jgi:hypothetical protein
MLTPPTITEGRTIRRMPAKRRDSWVMTNSIRGAYERVKDRAPSSR